MRVYRVVKRAAPLARLVLALVITFGSSASVGATTEATPPPDGPTGRIAYGTDEGIWVMDADGSHRRQVTRPGDGHFDYDPVWSPDGTELAFRSTRARGGDGILLVGVDNGNERDLAVLLGLPGGSGVAHASWSSTNRLAFTCTCPDAAGPHSGLYVANPDGSGLTKLTDDGQYPDWSPDGSRIVYMSDPEFSHELYVINADGTSRTRLMDNNVSDAVPDWSPDGRRIVFFSERDGNEEIYVMNADGSGVERVTQTPTNEEFPVWTPDGRIAFNDDRDGDGEIEWYLINPDGTGERELRQLTEARATNFIDWTPELSATLAATPAEMAPPSVFFAGRVVYHDEAGDLWAMTAVGTDRVRLTDSGEGFDFDPRWSPDGRRVLFRTSRYPGEPDADGLMLVDSDGTNERPLLPHGSFGDWSPDGSRIVATSADQGLVVLDPDGTSATPLGATGECARWSPDGTRIAYCHLEDDPSEALQWEVYVMNADGTGQTGLTDRSSYNYPSGWSPDGRQLIVWSQQGAPERLALMTVATGKETPLTGLASAHEVLADWLPDGRLLVGIDSPADGLHGWYLMDRSDPANPRFEPVLPELASVCCGEGQLDWTPTAMSA